MPYLERNSSGAVVALTSEPSGPEAEFVAPDHPDVLLFLAAGPGRPDSSSRSADGNANIDLLATDLSMIRVIEDVIDILITKNIIMFSELPLPVQEKLLRKKGQREKLFGVGDVIGNSDEEVML